MVTWEADNASNQQLTEDLSSQSENTYKKDNESKGLGESIQPWNLKYP